MNALTFVLQVGLAAGLLLQAAAAGLRARWLAGFGLPSRGSPTGRALGTALLLIATLGALAGAAVPFLAFFSGCLALVASIFMLLHALRARSAASVALAASTACLAIAVAILQPLGLKVLALPKAAQLPFLPAPARVVKTYDEGLWFEGIAASDDGTLYLAGNRNIDFSHSDYYARAHGEVIERKPDGTERVLFTTPEGSTAGVIAIGASGNLYMTSHGDTPSIWEIGVDGRGRTLVQFPRGAWPNGLDVGPDGMLYTPDSALGAVWRVDPSTGRAQQALQDERLMARPFISLAPGANGLHFLGRDMYVTVSDRTTVLKYQLEAGGRFAAPAAVATGIPGDDFAIGHDGSLFVTTHPYDTIVRVSPSGERTVVGGKQQHVVGATDAVFGRRESDRRTLYVVTDGGAFTGGPKTRGELLALQPYMH